MACPPTPDRTAIEQRNGRVPLPADAEIQPNDRLTLDLVSATLRNHIRQRDITVEALPAHLLAILACDGLIGCLAQRQSVTT